MKISKLFHWLYAILMLLPFAFFVPSVLYYAFNDNATMQTVEVAKTETISVDFNQKLNGNVSLQLVNNTSSNSETLYTNISFDSSHIYLLKWYQDNSSSSNVRNTPNVYFPVPINLAMYYNTSTNNDMSNTWYYWRFNPIVSGVGEVNYWYHTFESLGDTYVSNFQLFDLTQMFGVGNEPTIQQFDEWFTHSYYPYTESELKQITYDTGETEQLVENISIINYAWESIWDLPLFSWTKVTFVSVPFSYLTGIFGIGASNSLNYVFGYFVTISIVWLVFDLLLYVPMLAHNWIDKARIE